MKHTLYKVIWMLGLLPRLADAIAYDYYPLYAITFEAPYHAEDAAVAVATNELYAPSSLFQNGDTDGVMVRNLAGNQVCEFKWTGASSTNSNLNYEQMRMTVPSITTLLIEFDVLFPEFATDNLDNYQFALMMDTDTAAYRIDFNGDGQVGDDGSFQTGTWHRASISADMYYNFFEFRFDGEVRLQGGIYGNVLRGVRFNLWDPFGKGKAVYIDNVTISTGMVAKAAAYNIAEGYVVIADSDPHLIYGTSTVNTITVAPGVTAEITISNLNVQTTNRYQCAFSVASNSTANLTLFGSNALMSGRMEAALHVPSGAELSITNGDANGMLTAIGGGQGPGIGGGHQASGGRVSIHGGNIVAMGGFGAAGIGCGDFGMDGGIITIAGGTVFAQGGGIGEGGCGAGIGGGNVSAGGIITITGGKVTATGGRHIWNDACGAGIGGGHGKPGGLITISGGTVMATRGESDAQDIGTGAAAPEIGTNIFIGGSIKTSANAVWGAPTDTGGHAVYLLVVTNAVEGTNPISITLTNMQTGAIYTYEGIGHGDGDSHLYFYLTPGDYPKDAAECLGYFVEENGNSGTMASNPSNWTEEQRSIAEISVTGHVNMLTLIHPLGTHADNFSIEGADKVEDNGWNWRVIPYTVDEQGVVTINTNVPTLMLRLRF
jgi:hypothetical protein